MACNIVHPFLYVIDFKRALSFGEAQPQNACGSFLLPNETKSAEGLRAVPSKNYH
jgi:hypothetical protein